MEELKKVNQDLGKQRTDLERELKAVNGELENEREMKNEC